ncbi:hypothetical protein SORBI_3005G231400 [Sorghum bicolor]|uniref:Cyclin-like domain-containing protein n=1 Tax=Sorghum bicolor TaxID=4558 RepID=A0A1Z5RK60_SORBI|nr:hypothetical protein SORBI_3005G231400 [Sorghum bicolor]
MRPPAEAATWSICCCRRRSSRDPHHRKQRSSLVVVLCLPLAPEECTTSSMLGLTVTTVFNAVNYLDRFLSINCHLCWEAWMVELVSVACLSIACKLDEVNIPSLHHLQMEEVMSNSFLPATIQDMELTLLKALQWRLACVTPYSFLQLLLPLLTPHTTTTTTPSRCIRLLIRSLTEPSFIRFDPSVVASSALGCVVALEDHQTYGYISRLIRPHCPATAMDEADDGDECFRMMETLYASCCSESDWNWNTHHHHHHHHQPQLYSSDDERLRSPVSVIRRPLELETAGGGGGRLINSRMSAVSRRRLFGSSASETQGSTQLQDDGGNTHVRDEDISLSHTHN